MLVYAMNHATTMSPSSSLTVCAVLLLTGVQVMAANVTTGATKPIFCRTPDMGSHVGSWRGTGGRLQSTFSDLAKALDRKRHTAAAAAVRALESAFTAWANVNLVEAWNRRNGTRTAVKGGITLCNQDINGEAVQIQDLHMDMQELGLVVFLAIQPGSLHVVPHSHHIMEQVLAVHKKAQEAARRDADAGEAGDVDKHVKTLMAAYVKSIDDSTADRYKLYTVQYKSGELVVMHGLCVHAGAAGQLGYPAVRCHWVVQEADLEDEKAGGATFPLLAEGSVLARKLCFPIDRVA